MTEELTIYLLSDIIILASLVYVFRRNKGFFIVYLLIIILIVILLPQSILPINVWQIILNNKI